MRYRLIALDLDGTLLGRDQKVSREDAAAIDEVQAAGAIVVPCTGRSWRESAPYLSNISALDHGVFNTGAMVARMTTGEPLNSAAFDPRLALEVVEFLSQMPEAVLVFQDFGQTHCDYLVCGRGALTDETQQWFEANQLQARHVMHPRHEDLHHSLRISMVAIGAHGFEIEKRVARQFDGRISLHCFAGVPDADESKARFMVEIFAADVNKWRGIKWLATQYGIPDHEIAAVGDEVNDLPMLKHAGLGVAMGNAISPAKAVADRITLNHDAHGVAYALRQMLDGAW